MPSLNNNLLSGLDPVGADMVSPKEKSWRPIVWAATFAQSAKMVVRKTKAAIVIDGENTLGRECEMVMALTEGRARCQARTRSAAMKKFWFMSA